MVGVRPAVITGPGAKEQMMVAMNQPSGHRKSGGGRRSGGGGGAAAEGIGIGEIVDRAKEGAAGAARFLKDRVQTTVHRVKNATSEASGTVAKAVRDEAERVYGQQKGRVAARVNSAAKVARQVAHALRAVKAEKVADYVDEASRRAGQTKAYLEERTVTDMIQDAAELARRNGAIAVAGMAVAGFALARFLKAPLPETRPLPVQIQMPETTCHLTLTMQPRTMWRTPVTIRTRVRMRMTKRPPWRKTTATIRTCTNARNRSASAAVTRGASHMPPVLIMDL